MNVAGTSNSSYSHDISTRRDYNCNIKESSCSSEDVHLNDPKSISIAREIINIANTNKPLATQEKSSHPKTLQQIAAKEILRPKAKHNISDADLWNMASKIKEAAISPKLKNALPHVAAKLVRESVIETAKQRIRQGEHYKTVSGDLGIYKERSVCIRDEMLSLIHTQRPYSTTTSINRPTTTLPTLKNIDLNDPVIYRKLFEAYKERALSSLHKDSSPHKSSDLHDFFVSKANSFDVSLRSMKLDMDLELEFLSGRP